MKKMFFTAVLLAASVAVNAAQKGWISRYWDGCKPSCSWKDKAQHIPGTICKECDRENNPMPIDMSGAEWENNKKSSCESGGTAYTCWDMIPFADPDNPNQAYGYAAAPTDQCGKCFRMVFDGGRDGGWTPYATHAAIKNKVLTVMASNMGHDVGSGQFDILIPGGGVGAFDAFSNQLGVSKEALGKTYGGFLGDCEESLGYDPQTLANAQLYQDCLRNKCNAVFSNPKHALLKEGCLFYADWFMAANNPTMTYEEVACPQILIERYTTGGNTPTPGPTYTINRNPANAAKARGGVTLKPAPGGFTALLPAAHGYTSYKLVNVQGREVKRGKIGADANISVSGLTRGVFFLRLEGSDKTPTLKVVTY